MHYNLNNKKQRKNFWRDCEKAILKCVDEVNPEDYSWDVAKKLSPLDVYEFWSNEAMLLSGSNFGKVLSINAIDTFDYHEYSGIEMLESGSFDDDE